RRLATLLDGVYRRSEFYTRWLERLTSWTFGTDTGRWLTRNVFLPFGAALLAAQFVWLLVYERWKATNEHPPTSSFFGRETYELPDKFIGPAALGGTLPVAREAVPVVSAGPFGRFDPTKYDLEFFGGWNAQPWFHLAWLGLALVLLALIGSAAFRGAAVAAGRAVVRAGRVAFREFPLRLWNHPTVRALLTSWPAHLVADYLLKPAGLAA